MRVPGCTRESGAQGGQRRHFNEEHTVLPDWPDVEAAEAWLLRVRREHLSA